MSALWGEMGGGGKCAYVDLNGWMEGWMEVRGD